MDYDGETTVCGRFIAAEGEPCTELKVLKELFWVRVLLFADMVRSDMRMMTLGANSMLIVTVISGVCRILYARRVLVF